MTKISLWIEKRFRSIFNQLLGLFHKGKKIFLWIEKHQGVFGLLFTVALVLATLLLWFASKNAVEVANEALKLQKKLAEETLAQMQAQSKAMQVQADAAKISADSAAKSANIAQQSFDISTRSQLSIKAHREMFLSAQIGAGAGFQTSAGDRIGKPLEQVRTAGADTRTNADHRDKITLLFRNLSHRSTAVLDISIEGGRLDYDQITLPFRIKPWDVQKRVMRLEMNDPKQIPKILITDIDLCIFEVEPGQEWKEAKRKKCP